MYRAAQGLGATDRPECAYFLSNYGTPQWPTFLPAQICPAVSGKTGHSPPRARPCDGGLQDLRDALGWLGYATGPFSDAWTPGVAGAVGSVAAKYGLPFDGTQWGVTPEICSALVYEMKTRLPSCTEQDARTMHGEAGACWSNRAPGGARATAPGGPPPGPGWTTTEPTEPAPPPPPVTPTLRPEAYARLRRATLRVPPMRTPSDVTGPLDDTKGWWDGLTTTKKVMVAGGVAVVVAGGAYMLLR